MKEKLAVFDMDGTLFDTSEINFRAYAAAAEKLGKRIDRERFMKTFVGKNYKEFLPLFGITKDSDLELVHAEKKKLYTEYLGCARVNQPLFDLIHAIKGRYVIVLATTASRKNTEDILERFQKRELFDYVITQDDLQRLKPDPECYLEAMRITGISAKNTIIFEDSEAGIRAGKASGATVYKMCGF